MTDAKKWTYRDAGVDADLGDALVERIQSSARRSHRPGVVAGIGGFAALFSLKEAMDAARARGAPIETMQDPLLVSGTDGVGTKLLLAIAMGRHDSVGIDLVAMCINDVITVGALPLFFLDYFASARLDIDVAANVIEGIVKGCELANVALVGGETAELPGLYRVGDYDLAGFAVGVVDRGAMVDGRTVVPGDRVIGLRSSGVHSNGFSLVRRVLFDSGRFQPNDNLSELGVQTIGECLLAPTRIYTSAVETLLKVGPPKALAHITGGGIVGNLPRVMPPHTRAVLYKKEWPEQAIFRIIQQAGNIDTEEMDRTFNMGLGMIAIVARDKADRMLRALRAAGDEAFLVGEVVARSDHADPDVRLET